MGNGPPFPGWPNKRAEWTAFGMSNEKPSFGEIFIIRFQMLLQLANLSMSVNCLKIMIMGAQPGMVFLFHDHESCSDHPRIQAVIKQESNSTLEAWKQENPYHFMSFPLLLAPLQRDYNDDQRAAPPLTQTCKRRSREHKSLISEASSSLERFPPPRGFEQFFADLEQSDPLVPRMGGWRRGAVDGVTASSVQSRYPPLSSTNAAKKAEETIYDDGTSLCIIHSSIELMDHVENMVKIN